MWRLGDVTYSISLATVLLVLLILPQEAGREVSRYRTSARGALYQSNAFHVFSPLSAMFQPESPLGGRGVSLPSSLPPAVAPQTADTHSSSPDE